ncbi:glutathione peroxidase [Neisseria sp. Ec49-e6-T10]|uniref:glutathione peroxidase n=1 Tax=Neisseria sp. Ec49-e6-T10 TaxID=3140744 RepID=UPI003EB6FC8C
MTSFYDFSLESSVNTSIPMSQFKGRVVLIVNTASKCGFAPQLSELAKLAKQYKAEGLNIVLCPCDQFLHQEPLTNEEIVQFCALNYDSVFIVSKKLMVNGQTADPLWHYLKQQQRGIVGSTFIKWNFTKFLINRQGIVVRRFAPIVPPFDLEHAIVSLLQHNNDQDAQD